MRRHLFIPILLSLLMTGCSFSEGIAQTEITSIQSITEPLISTTVQEECVTSTPDISLSGVELLRVHFLDVGQGDSIFIELPDNKTMLIDASERDYGAMIVNYIQSLGYSKIDYIVATHNHSDHIGGMDTVINNFDVDYAYLSIMENTTKTYERMLSAIEKQDCIVSFATAGMEIDNSSVELKILAPHIDSDMEEINNSSIVLYLKYQDIDFLFMGDAEIYEEDTIENIPDIDILKVGHHGSNTSSSLAFLQETRPEVAIISCGVDNSYGHPHSSTLSNLNNVNATVYRTDSQGTIVVTSDGSSYTVDEEKFLDTSSTDIVISEPVGKYILNTKTHKIHNATCRYATEISEENREVVSSIDDYLSSGYTRCKVCNP